jgi:hypothetical protein
LAHTFLEKDIEEANRFLIEWKNFNSIEEMIHHYLEELRDELSFPGNVSITGFLHDLQFDLKFYGIANRVALGNVSYMTEALIYSARFGYLLRINGGEAYSCGYDCIHIFDLLVMLAASDSKAIDVLTSQFMAPFRKGNADTVLLCNAVYMALDKHPDPGLTLKSIERSKATKFFLSMYRCAAAIQNVDRATFMVNLKELLKGNRRQEFHSTMDKAVCIEAHAMVNLWNIRNNNNTIDLSALELPWDSAFYKFTLNTSEPHLSDFSGISTVLNHWIHLMPDDINVDDFLTELNESWFKKLIRRIRITHQKEKLDKALHRTSR